MMLQKYIQEQQKKLEKSDFYSSGGIHVYFKDPVDNDEINVELCVSHLEKKVPSHLLGEIEMIIIGWFEEFAERHINAFYKDGALHISNVQDDAEDLFDDILHETAHSIETPYGHYLYGDDKLKKEFLRKRKHLHDILWANGFKAPETFFANTEYNKEFDMFLYEKIGYDKLSSLMSGLFINPYAATSLSEYFATAFTEFYINSNHKFLKTISPAVYKKLFLLQDEEKVDELL